jgi:hypothetical protein
MDSGLHYWTMGTLLRLPYIFFIKLKAQVITDNSFLQPSNFILTRVPAHSKLALYVQKTNEDPQANNFSLDSIS